MICKRFLLYYDVILRKGVSCMRWGLKTRSWKTKWIHSKSCLNREIFANENWSAGRTVWGNKLYPWRFWLLPKYQSFVPKFKSSWCWCIFICIYLKYFSFMPGYGILKLGCTTIHMDSSYSKSNTIFSKQN